MLAESAATEPTALVLIGHTGDPRQWQCTPATQPDCASAFVVDRIAWAAGRDVALSAPQTGDQRSGQPLSPVMTPDQVIAAAGGTDTAVTVAVFMARDVATVDPRWNLAGENLVWIVRSVGQAASPDDPARPETVDLVDDGSGRVLDSQPLKVDASYQPARVWLEAALHGVNCCASNLAVFERVESADGTGVYEGRVPGGVEGSANTTTFGGSYGSLPLALPAGPYSVTIWTSTDARGATEAPSRGCSTTVTFRPLDVVTLDADFPAGEACSFHPGPPPRSFP